MVIAVIMLNLIGSFDANLLWYVWICVIPSSMADLMKFRNCCLVDFCFSMQFSKSGITKTLISFLSANGKTCSISIFAVISFAK